MVVDFVGVGYNGVFVQLCVWVCDFWVLDVVQFFVYCLFGVCSWVVVSEGILIVFVDVEVVVIFIYEWVYLCVCYDFVLEVFIVVYVVFLWLVCSVNVLGVVQLFVEFLVDDVVVCVVGCIFLVWVLVVCVFGWVLLGVLVVGGFSMVFCVCWLLGCGNSVVLFVVVYLVVVVVLVVFIVVLVVLWFMQLQWLFIVQ